MKFGDDLLSLTVLLLKLFATNTSAHKVPNAMSKNQRMSLTANATINVIKEWIMFVGGHKKQVLKRGIITNAILIGKHVNETKQLKICTYQK